MNPERHARLRAVLDRRQPDLTVVMDRVHKPHNLAAILRTCDAVGVMRVHAVPVEEGLELSRAAAGGSTRWVKVVRHPDLVQALRRLRASGHQVVAAHPGPTSVDFREVDYTGPSAFLLGTELDGLSEVAMDAADVRVTIPMVGMVTSLNVSVAAALLLYESMRQREAAGLYDGPRLSPDERDRLLFRWGYRRLAKHLDDQGTPYPALDDRGAIIGIPGTAD